MNAAFWAGKRVFVTGHTGFMGGWLSLWLQRMNAEVSGYALKPPTEPNLFSLAGISNELRASTIADIRDIRALTEALKTAQPEIVFHLAAQPLVRRSFAEPVETYSTNVMGTVNLLEAVRQVSTIKTVVNITSDKCYENRERPEGYREEDAMGGYDPYSSSKGCSELVTAAYRRSFLNEAGISLVSARAGNVIGGGDWAEDRLIPDFIRAVIAGRPLHVRNPASIRPWQHVLEPIRGYFELVEKAFAGQEGIASGWNFGPHEQDAKPVGWLAKRLTETWGGGAAWVSDPGPHVHEAGLLHLDISKAARELDWHPRWDLSRTMDEVVVWYKGWSHGKDMRALSLNQIEGYEQTVEAAA